MIYYYHFHEDWSPHMDEMLGYYYETEEIAGKRLLDNGYLYDENEGSYIKEWSTVDVVGVRKYKEEK